MRSKTSLTLAPTPHHHSEKASPSLQVKSKMGQLKFKTSTLTFNTPRKFLPNERKRKTAQKHTWSSSACWRCPQRQLRPGFRPLCALHTGFRTRRMCSLHIRGSVSQGMGWFWLFNCYIFFPQNAGWNMWESARRFIYLDNWTDWLMANYIFLGTIGLPLVATCHGTM